MILKTIDTSNPSIFCKNGIFWDGGPCMSSSRMQSNKLLYQRAIVKNVVGNNQMTCCGNGRVVGLKQVAATTTQKQLAGAPRDYSQQQQIELLLTDN